MEVLFIHRAEDHKNRSIFGLNMEQKHVLLSALSVGVGVGLGLASGQAVNKWTGGNSAAEGITADQIEQELRRLFVDGKHTKVSFEDFPYFLR